MSELLVVAMFGTVGIILCFIAIVYLLFVIKDNMEDMAGDTDKINENLILFDKNIQTAVASIPNYFQTNRAISTRQKKAALKEQFGTGMQVLDSIGLGKIGTANPEIAAVVDGMSNQILGKVMTTLQDKLPQMVEGLMKPAAQVIKEEVTKPKPTT